MFLCSFKGIPVDRHVKRLSIALRWATSTTNVEKIRLELENWLPPAYWPDVNVTLASIGQLLHAHYMSVVKHLRDSGIPETIITDICQTMRKTRKSRKARKPRKASNGEELKKSNGPKK